MELDDLGRHIEWVQSRLGKIRPATEDDHRNPRFMWEEAAETLNVTFEELRVAEEEIRQQGDELIQSRNKIEAELDRYRELFQSAPAALLLTDATGIVREANLASSTLLGVPSRHIVGKPLANFVAMEDRARFRLALNRLARSEPPAALRAKLVPRHGGPFDASFRVSAEREARGEAPTSLRWMILPDEPKADGPPAPRSATGPEAESAELATLRSLVDGIDAVAWQADAETRRLLVIGRHVEGMLGFPIARWLEDPALWSTLLHPDDRAVANGWRDRCFREGAGGAFEYRLLSLDGRIIWVIETISVDRGADGRPTAVRGVMLDISRRKKAERQLYSARRELADRLADRSYLDEVTARLSGLSEPVQVATEALTAIAAIVGAELGVARLRGDGDGLETAAAIGLDADYIDRFGRSAIGEGPCDLAGADGGPVAVDDLFLRPADNRTREAATAGGYRAAFSVPIRDGDGELSAVVTVFFRERHRPPDRQVRLVERYAPRAAGVLDVALRHRAACMADRRKDELLATLAHELRTPLMAVLATAETLGLDDQAAAARARDRIAHQVGVMARLIDDLMDASRLSLGSLALRPEPIATADAIARAIEDTRPLVESRRHALAVDLPEGPLLVLADPDRLQQVLVNLVSNAAKFTGPGGRIAVGARRDGDEVVFSVRDSGIVLEAEERSRIFEPFAQLGHAEGRPPDGFGIGLALVKSLVELHGGSVDVRSDGPGLGAEFLVRLPEARGEPGRGDPPAARGAVAARRVLVVDDEPDSARALARLLTFWGHDVAVADDARTALEQARRLVPEVVLLDINLPGTDGHEVARRLRDQSPSARLIAVSGFSRDADRRRALEAGCEAFLVKPVDPAELARRIAEPPVR